MCFRGIEDLADMHTHSENSHDSACPIEEMLNAQLINGIRVFAVTDHFDTASHGRYDIFTPIRTSFETAQALNRRAEGRYRILTGIEIGEGFWDRELCDRAVKMLDYDVVLGSVHLVRYRDLTCAYSGIDFSKLSAETIAEYLDAYFDDVLTMIRETDFDILSHLTCPLRYINGRYKLSVDIGRYQAKIEKILHLIIEKGIALEVNTSSYGQLGDFMPPISILKKYRDMGGYLLTLGSDAHVCENASQYFTEALRVIREVGFENIYYYEKRKPCPIRL